MIDSETSDNGSVHAAATDEPRTGATESIELNHAGAGDVQGDRITMDQSSAGTVTGAHVRVNRSAIRSLTMTSGTVSQSASAMLTSTDMAMHESAVGYVAAERVDLFDSRVGLLHGALTVRGGSAKVFLHIGRSESGIKPVLSGETALKLGAGLGITCALVSRLLRRLMGS